MSVTRRVAWSWVRSTRAAASVPSPGSSLRSAEMTRSARSRAVTTAETRSPRSSTACPTRGRSRSSTEGRRSVEVGGGLVVGQDGPDPPPQGPQAPPAQLGPAGRPEDVGQLVGLVEHRHVVLGEQDPAGGQVEPVVVMVGDDDVGRRGPLPSPLGEALAARGAAGRPRALVSADRDRRPDVVRRRRVELLPVTGRRVGRPHQHVGQVVVGVAPPEQLQLLLPLGPLQLAEALEAQVVAAALEQRHRDRAPEGLGHQRHVAVDQLGLEGDRGRGHHRPPALGHDRHEIGQRFPGSGPGLDEQVAVAVQGLGHQLGHADLARSALPAARQRSDDLLHWFVDRRHLGQRRALQCVVSGCRTYDSGVAMASSDDHDGGLDPYGERPIDDTSADALAALVSNIDGERYDPRRAIASTHAGGGRPAGSPAGHRGQRPPPVPEGDAVVHRARGGRARPWLELARRVRRHGNDHRTGGDPQPAGRAPPTPGAAPPGRCLPRAGAVPRRSAVGHGATPGAARSVPGR